MDRLTLKRSLIAAAAAFIPVTATASGTACSAGGRMGARQGRIGRYMRLGPYDFTKSPRIRVGLWNPIANDVRARRHFFIRALDARNGDIIATKDAYITPGGGSIVKMDGLPPVDLLAFEVKSETLETKEGNGPLRVTLKVLDGDKIIGDGKYEAWPCKWNAL